jgi:hypothetical protein
MKGLLLARRYYEEYGRRMLHEKFPSCIGRVAVGLVGEGSEAFGYDDEISRDHDFGAAFCMWLTDEDYDGIGDALNAAFEKLPCEFMGFHRRETECHGIRRIGAMRTSEFYARYIGVPDIPKTFPEWRRIPGHFLAVVTNGEVFTDRLGEFSRIREELLAFYPEDIRLKKLAACTARMAQSGQYNYGRCIDRGERVAALSALSEFVDAAEGVAYLLNRRYKPYYKWAHRGMRDMALLPGAYRLLQCIETAARSDHVSLMQYIEELCGMVICELKRAMLSDVDSDFLLHHADEVMQRISDPALRALNVFAE